MLEDCSSVENLKNVLSPDYHSVRTVFERANSRQPLFRRYVVLRGRRLPSGTIRYLGR